MSTRQILGAVGAAIGGYFFGPTGAQWGWAIGSAVGGAIDPEIIKGPSVGDIAAQTSQEGVPRPIVFALSQPIAGNIIASSEPRIVRKRQRQGKGGPKVETESVYRTYAIGVCEGPITRFVRVWRNGQLVFDAEALAMNTERTLTVFGISFQVPTENNGFLGRARFFLGDWDQNASPDLEHIFGVGTTPAHRGTAYMVMADEDLTDLRGAIPQYQFQVERCEGVFLTSRPYPLEDVGAIGVTNSFAEKLRPLTIEGMSVGGSLVSGTLPVILVTYDDAETEAISAAGTLIAGFTSETTFLMYDDGLPEGIDVDGTLQAGSLEVILVPYDDYPPEGIETDGALISGTLT